jgi:chromosome segregation ATPase
MGLTADDFGPLLGAIPVALVWLAREWWKAKSASRADAVDSANAKAGINMLATAQAERDQAEKELSEERKERLSAERALTTAVADQRDTQRDLASAMRDIAMLQRKLDKHGVPRSEWAPLMETTFGDL